MSIFKRLAADRGGNFGMMTAIMLPVLMGAAGFAMDFSNAMQVKSSLQGIADSASLAAASAMSQQGYTKAQAEELAKNYFVSQIIADGMSDATTTSEKSALAAKIRAATTATAKENAASGNAKATYTVTLDSLYAMNLNPITGVVAGKSMNIAINAVATTGTDGNATRTGISMYLALDLSGSMSFVTSTKNTSKSKCDNYTSSSWPYVDFTRPCYVRKIEALQTASTALFDALKKADASLTGSNSTSTLVRTGADSYTHETQKESAMAWGTSAAASYIQALPSVPTGGTDANGALDNAYNALKQSNTTESKAHTSKSNDSFNRYIVLMTDGEMTANSNEWDPGLDKSVRTKCDTAKKDGIIIFTVAFMAPANGKALLKNCATSADYYYSPEDMSALVEAFGEIADKAAKQTVRLTN
jgi:Flp pilus assembly protein TadG